MQRFKAAMQLTGSEFLEAVQYAAKVCVLLVFVPAAALKPASTQALAMRTHAAVLAACAGAVTPVFSRCSQTVTALKPKALAMCTHPHRSPGCRHGRTSKRRWTSGCRCTPRVSCLTAV